MTRGVDDRQAVVTFAKPFSEWRGMFAGNTMLLPKSMTADPEVFNKGQLDHPGPSAGPFIITSLDRTAQRITLTRNPKWWGTPALLDTITYLVLDDKARLPALQNNTIDATGVASLSELTTARNTAGISIRRAPSPSWYHFTFNGAPGSILADKDLRLAVAKGIDRQAIANVTQRGLVDKPVPLNNHIYVAGQEGYQDNSEVVAYDPEKAKQELDALGWRMNGQFREKDGRQLVIRDVLYDADTTKQVGQIAQNSLAQIGVKLELDTKGGGGFFTNYIIPGDFDIAQFSWVGDAFSLCCLNQIYTTNADSNFGKISSPDIDAKVEETFDELDPAKARELANELDKLIFGVGFSLPLFQSPGNLAVRSNLANFGPAGIGDLDVHQDRVHEVIRCALDHVSCVSRLRTRFTHGSASIAVTTCTISASGLRPRPPIRRAAFSMRCRRARNASAAAAAYTAASSRGEVLVALWDSLDRFLA